MIGASFEREEIYECRKHGPIDKGQVLEPEIDTVNECYTARHKGCGSVVDIYSDMDAYLYDDDD